MSDNGRMMSTSNFLSYIRTRYPYSTKNVPGSQIPEYDGFCLDINSIIFANIYCDEKSFSIEEIIENIAEHIDFLFRFVKPTKFVFIAFDGVLPDAKLNYLKHKLITIRDNICIAKDNSFLNTSRDEFDLSYFAAGTQFINQLFSALKHFVAYKISTDSKWQKHKIFINGPEIPGESKVKIVQFIRYYKVFNKSQITKYCLYSFDPDLLLLGLSTHEPYISIMQDRTSPMKIKKDSLTPEETEFLITHLSLIREILEHEFSLFQGKLKFEFDFENMLDDWILIGILISTYSLPRFSHLNIENDALSIVFNTYLKVLRSLDGYINEFGELNVNRLQTFMNKLSTIEMKVFESDNCAMLDNEQIKHKLKCISIDEIFSKKNKEGKKKELPAIPTKIRNEYYKKFESQSNSDLERIVPTVVSEYIKSIQWNLKYYYQDCCCWSWTYPYSESPLISDMLNLDNIDLSFEIGKPLDTLNFLLLALPSSSIKNIPIDEKGDSYTNKKICLLTHSELMSGSLPEQYGFSSFINHADLRFIKLEDLNVSKEDILKKSIATIDNNTSGFQSFFPSLRHISFKFHLELKKDSLMFPLESRDRDDSYSANEVLILDVSSHISRSFEEVAAQVLGKSFFVNWPYIKEAYVYSITNLKNEISLKTLFTVIDKNNMTQKKLSKNEIKTLKETIAKCEKMYNSIGIRIGTTKLLLGVHLKVGDCYTYDPHDTMKLRSICNLQTTTFVPYQLLAKRAYAAPVLRYKFVHNVFNITNLCFMIGHPHYGSLGEIKSVMSPKKQMSIRLNVVNESKDYFKSLFKTHDLYNYKLLKYLDISSVAEILDLKPSLLHVICKSVYLIEKKIENGVVKQKKHDVGLKLQYPTNSQEQTLAYTVKRDSFWFFSKTAVELIRNYILEFPEIIEMIDKNTNTKEYDVSECFKNVASSLKKIDKWLRKSKKIITAVQTDIQKFILDNVNTLEKIVLKNKSVNEEIDVDVSPKVLFKPGMTSGLVAPDERARHDLLDRIICVRENFTVPFGLKGTIINIISFDTSKWYNIYEVVFDSPFPGGLTLYGSAECKCYRLTVADFLNISYGKRNRENDINDQNEEKVKMKKSIKLVNKNIQKKEVKKLTQRKEKVQEKSKLPKFARKCSRLDFSVN